jgi:hypothetical protein
MIPRVKANLQAKFAEIKPVFQSSQLIKEPSCMASPCGSDEPGTISAVTSTLPVAASYFAQDFSGETDPISETAMAAPPPT